MKRYFLFSACIIALAIASGKLAYAVDFSSLYHNDYNGDFDTSSVPYDSYDDFDDYDIILMSLVDSYSSTIPEPYLSYLQSIALSRAPFKHYVSYVSRETFSSGSVIVYNIAVGNLSFSSGRFAGDVTLYKIYSNSTYSSQYQIFHDSNFTLNPSGTLVFTDLFGTDYPDFTSKYISSYYILYIVILFIVFFTVTSFFRRKR